MTLDVLSRSVAPTGDGVDTGHHAPEAQVPCAGVDNHSVATSDGASGHGGIDHQTRLADRKPSRRPKQHATQERVAARGGDGDAVKQSTPVRAAHPVTAELVPLCRRHSQWHSAWMRLVLQGKAIGRGYCAGDKTAGAKMYDEAVEGTLDACHEDLAITLMPLITAAQQINAQVEAIEKAIEKVAKRHPLWAWAKDIYGIGPGTLGKIIAQAHSPAETDRDGNPRTPAYEIGDYKTLGGLWKRFGLAVIDGERQRKKQGEEGIAHAYNARRRALIWNLGNSLIGAMGKLRPVAGEDAESNPAYSPLQKLFIARLRYEAARDPAMRLPDKIAKGLVKESYKTHASNRAKRYVEKRFLKELYAVAKAMAAGRGQAYSDSHEGIAAPPPFALAAE